MFKSYRSIVRQLHNDSNLTPSYCPNSRCPFHLKREANFVRHGFKAIKRFPYRSIRFRCKTCDKTFTASFFRLEYRQKIWEFNDVIHMLDGRGVSKREIARLIGHSECMVRKRLIKLSRWCLLKHAKLSAQVEIAEPIVYDGLENFSYSQYDPNNINHAVGKRSLFTYDFNFCPLNRKGRMSPYQVRRKLYIEKTLGAYPADAIRTASCRIFRRLSERSKKPLTLYSDNHFQYRRAIQHDLKGLDFDHVTVSSKISRNFWNPLFAVNNIDLQARHNLAPFKRETIAFSKRSIAMMESFLRYMTYRNYMRPKFWGTHRSDPLCSQRSPAMELGITKRILDFRAFFDERICPTQVKLHPEWLDLYNRIDPLSRYKIDASPTI